MSATNGNRKPPRPRIELISPAASAGEAAAIVAALEQFLADTAPAPDAGGADSKPMAARGPRGGHRRAAGERLRLGSRAAIELVHAGRPEAGSPEEENVAVVKIIELVGSSKTSTDDAAKQALTQAQSSLRNIRAVDIVSTGIRGENLDEYRAHVRVAFLIDNTDVD